MQKTKYQLFYILTALILVSSCAQRYQTTRYSVRQQIEIGSLLQAAEYWLKTPYRYGGNNERGIDCSGLVCAIYREVYGLELPRPVKSQRLLGSSVRISYIRPGDLLFFQMKGRGPVNHVAVYLGSNEFIHASSSRGVVISSLRDSFYRERLFTARRVLR